MARSGQVVIARVYDVPADARGTRILVDRLWPRGVAKVDAPFSEWLKEIAPSTELRKWYGHAPERFDEFARRYRAELTEAPANDALAHLRATAASEGVVLLTASKDLEHSEAAVLRSILTRGAERA